MSARIRLGVLGTAKIVPGAILAQAAEAGVDVVAVASRTEARVRAFAKEHGIPRAHASYQALVDDAELDAVYVALPASMHADWSIAALARGKHVLCEKPFALCEAQARVMVEAATRAGRLLVEAMHDTYHPFMAALVEACRPERIGAVERASAVFTVPIPAADDIRKNAALGGGAMMDLGCYTVRWLRDVLREEPRVVSARAVVVHDDIDESMEGELAFPSGCIARFACSMAADQRYRTAITIVGTNGTVEARNPLSPQTGNSLRLVAPDGSATSTRIEGGSTYAYQLRAFADAVRTGGALPTGGEDACLNMRVLDAVYAAAGLPPRSRLAGA